MAINGGRLRDVRLCQTPARSHELITIRGWGIPIARPTLMITVGGIATKPRYIDAQLQPREMLDLTISTDHEVVDGAPAARFARRLAELVEQADGLSG